ncbi:putative molybdenum cofactor guanylyltransferase [Geobacter sp. OR-1]|uniref:molybdenum cofactor guanylyltransferase n=1 Tax=Geobacter sp. OR-1 TaxID=1266765 RepID=UPI0005430835|nr:molybdenum cofactor guanylyltransferase [Geobacter sp. OR-1]GAM09117.1 putative molybdenum cofactor guanylyltransferase [Geobacter sp. OR-1]
MPNNLEQTISGVILVGGKSRRMGRDKAFLKIGGVTIFERIAGLFRESFSRVLLVGDREERFAGYNLPVIPDIYPGSALGGVYTGLYHAQTEHVFVTSCDLPFPNRELLRYLCSLRHGYDAVVPLTEHGYEPLFALYSKNCLGPIRELLESGNYCAFAYYPQVKARYVQTEELARFDRDGRAFVNVNTPEDFERISE